MTIHNQSELIAADSPQPLSRSQLQELNVSRLFTPELCRILDSASPDALHSVATGVYIGTQVLPELRARETIITSSREQARDPSATQGNVPFIRIMTEDAHPLHKPFICEHSGSFDQLAALVDTAVNRLTTVASTAISPEDLEKKYREGRIREMAERPNFRQSSPDAIAFFDY